MLPSAKAADGRPGGVQCTRRIGGTRKILWDAEPAARVWIGIVLQRRAEVRCARAAWPAARPIGHNVEELTRLVDVTEIELRERGRVTGFGFMLGPIVMQTHVMSGFMRQRISLDAKVVATRCDDGKAPVGVG